MSADQLIQYLTWLVFVLIFLNVTFDAFRRPSRARIDIALLFSLPTLIILIGVAAGFELLQPGPVPNAVNTSLVMALGYMLLRLVDDFMPLRVGLLRVAAATLAALALAAFVFSPPRPPVLTVLFLAYLLVTLAYAARCFVYASRRASGVTRRRLWVCALACLLLMLVFVLSSLNLALPALAEVWALLAHIAALGAALSFLLGFAPPRWLRRAWQEPELRAFLGRAASLPRLPNTAAIIDELRRGAAAALGAQASIGIWDEPAQLLRFQIGASNFDLPPDSPVPAAQAFRTRRAVFSPHTRYTGAVYAAFNTAVRAQAVLAAPISSDTRQLGVLVVYAPRAPIFAEDDLALVQLLADQAAVILESRLLIDEVTRVRAREEATRLKDDFLSAAAHELKSPLTTLVAQAQLLERRALRQPNTPTDLAAIQRLLREGQRLRRLVLELLDATQVEAGGLVGMREQVDLAALAQTVCDRLRTPRHSCSIEANTVLLGFYDPQRMTQMLEHLVENAVCYSPSGGVVQLQLWQDAAGAHIVVSDQGIGVPLADLPLVFERFHRASNVDARQFPGLGLGLYITRGIVEQHGGRIVMTARPDGGSRVYVTLPLTAVEVAAYA